ncbi:MAG: alpha/beta fold hydrolase, partial [Candidatus Korarchaeota archaeon]
MRFAFSIQKIGEAMLIGGLICAGILFGTTGYPVITANVKIQHLSLTSLDGVPFTAAYITPQTNYTGKPLIVVCHGFASSYENTVSIGVRLAQVGFPVIAPSFRGHTLSGGASRLGKYEWQEVSASINWVETHDTIVNTTNTGLIGTSMGAAIAMVAAAMDNRVKAVVEFSGFANLSSLINETLLRYFFGGFESLYSEVIDFAPVAYLTSDKNFSLLILHGDADDIVPLSQAIMLNNSALPDKEIMIFPGKKHDLVTKNEAFNYGFKWLCNKLNVAYPGDVDVSNAFSRLSTSYLGLLFIYVAIMGLSLLIGESMLRDEAYEKLHVEKPRITKNFDLG